MKMVIEVEQAKDNIGVERTARFYKRSMTGALVEFRVKAGCARTYEDAVSDAALFAPLVAQKIADGGV